MNGAGSLYPPTYPPRGKTCWTVLALALAGCTTPAPLVWVKPGATVEEFRRDKYQCVQESRTAWSGGGSGLIGLSIMASQQRQAQQQSDALFRLCMESKGYESHSKTEGEDVRQ